MLRNFLLLVFTVGSIIFSVACGGGGSGSPGMVSTPPPVVNNTVPIVVDSGPANITQPPVNLPFVSVTVCVPGSSTCQTIDHVQLDSGSSGLRILASVLTLPLPQQNDGSGNPIVECNQFVVGSTWGPIQTADVKLAGEQASAVPIQVINANFRPIPAACPGPAQNDANALQANGLLGVGIFKQDCGAACVQSTSPGVYYNCPAAGCQLTLESLASQVQNPVAMFPSDNNGVLIELPAISANGQSTVSGSLIFGIGTQSNNALNGATVLTLNPSGNFTTQFRGQTFTNSNFIDSGSNGFFFLDAATSGLPICPDTKDFYCPASTTQFMVTNIGANNASSNVTFSIANADTLFTNTTAFAFNDLGGPNTPQQGQPNGFDFGLPFFFGKNVYSAIEQQNTPAGPGPYVAY
jgi:Protein of unknown function (DUF3443).